MNGEKAEGGREKCAWKKTVLVFRCGEERVGQKEESICEKCALGKIFLQSSETIRRSSWKVCEQGGEEKAMLMKQEKRKFRWRGDKERENK